MAYSEELICNADSAMMLPIGGNANIAAANHPISVRLTQIGQNMRFNEGSPWGVAFYKKSHGGPDWAVRTVNVHNNNSGYLNEFPLTFETPGPRTSGVNSTREPLRLPHRYPNNYTPYNAQDNVCIIYNEQTKIHRLIRNVVWQHHRANIEAMHTIARSPFHRWHGTAPGDRQGSSASGVFNMFGVVHGEIVNAGLKIPNALQCIASMIGTTQLLSDKTVLPATSTDGSVQTNAAHGTGPCPYGATLTYVHGATMPSGLSTLGQLVWTAIYEYGLYPVDGNTNDLVIRTDQFINASLLSAWTASGDGPKIMQGLRPVLADGANPSTGQAYAWQPGITSKGGGTPRAQNFGHGNGAVSPPPTSEPTVLNAIARRIVDD